MRLCYHPHVGTGVMTEKHIKRLMENTDRDQVHLLLDTGHLVYAEENPRAYADKKLLPFIKKYAHRIKHVHLKNVRMNVLDKARERDLSFQEAILEGVFTVPGDEDGALNFDSILKVLAQNGYEGWLVVEAEQDPAKANPLAYAQMARKYLHKALGW
jgi:inosose dehydratase